MNHTPGRPRCYVPEFATIDERKGLVSVDYVDIQAGQFTGADIDTVRHALDKGEMTWISAANLEIIRCWAHSQIFLMSNARRLWAREAVEDAGCLEGD